MDSKNAQFLMNGVVVCTDIYTGDNSAIQYSFIYNLAAKKFYLLSITYSMSAITNCEVSLMSRACERSGVGIL